MAAKRPARRLLSWQGGSVSRQGPRPASAVTLTQWLLSAVRQSTASRSAAQQACCSASATASWQGGCARAAADAGDSGACAAASAWSDGGFDRLPALPPPMPHGLTAPSAASPSLSSASAAVATGDSQRSPGDPASGRSSEEESEEDAASPGPSGSSTSMLLLRGCLPMLAVLLEAGAGCATCADHTDAPRMTEAARRCRSAGRAP
jgi:hypothetical protein